MMSVRLDDAHGSRGSVEPGATTSMRHADAGEVEGLLERRVYLAQGEASFIRCQRGAPKRGDE